MAGGMFFCCISFVFKIFSGSHFRLCTKEKADHATAPEKIFRVFSKNTLDKRPVMR